MTSPGSGTDARSGPSCAECHAPLATDQAYCIRCGARRGPLPTRIAVALSDISERSAPTAPDEPVSEDESQPEAEPDIVKAAGSGVIALLITLAFGVVIGGAFSPGGLGALANTIVVAVRPAVQQAAQVITSPTTVVAGGGFTGGGGGGGSPSSSVGGSGAPVAPRAAATAPASTPAPVTVTVSQSAPTTTGTAPTTPTATLPPIGHVWLIVLGQQGYQQAWVTDARHAYLMRLKKQGELIPNYDAVASSELANEIALLSGQGPTPQTVANCPTYTNITPATIGKLQQVLGDGCIYPQAAETLPQDLVNLGLTWKAYIQGIGEGSPCPSSTTASTTSSTTTSSSSVGSACAPATPPTSTTPTAPPVTTTTTPTTTSGTDPVDTIGAKTCPHPALNSASLNQSATAHSTYVNWKNPVIYFQGLLLAGCDSDDVGIGQLAKDLKNPGATPAFSYIEADPCDDGSDTPCRPGAKGGLAGADEFLHRIVPQIERSAAYKQDGLILITFASAPQSGPHWDTSSCCGQPTYPNLAAPSSSSSSSTTSTTTAAASPPTASTPTTPTPTTPVVTTTETVTTTTTPTSTTSSTTPAVCDTGSSSSTTTGAAAASAPTAPTATTSSSTTTASTTTPGECGPVIVGTPPGGGQVGLLMISPWVDRDKTDVFDTLNHFSLLKGIEQLFKLPRLGYASVGALPGFSASMFASSRH